MKQKEGLIYFFYGDGKGKTSAAIGVSCRMLLQKKEVVWISWYKEKKWKISEMKMVDVFKNNLKMYWTGKGFCGGPMDHETIHEHKKVAIEAVELAKKVLTEKNNKGTKRVDLLVLDEIARAVSDNLIEVDSVLELIKMRGETHLVLTGHSCPPELVGVADLITYMKKIKHPYDKGILAVSGLDF